MVIKTEKAPQAIGPFSQGITTNNLVFVSGQLPIDPSTNEFIPGSIKEQTEQSLKNLSEVLKEAGSNINNVVKTTVYLSDMNHFIGMNQSYSKFFEEGNYPARTTIEVSKLPLNALVEIDAIAKI